MFIELIGVDNRAIILKIDGILKIVKDRGNLEQSFIQMTRGESYRVKHSIDSLRPLLDVSSPFADELMRLEREQEQQQLVVDIETQPIARGSVTYDTF